jgi:mono/diheme cytochrome c family protein
MRITLLTLAFALASASAAYAQAPDGKALFEKNCRKCHGDGQPSPGIKKLFPEIPTWDEAFFAKRTEADIIAVLTNGKGKNMKPWKEALSPEEMAAVAKYIRTLRP